MAQLVRIGHSPDADDAFMFYALTHGKVATPGVRIEHVLEDIESLNRRAATGELEVTAVSCATYPAIAGQYRLMDPGASMGKGYGPIVVAREALSPESLPERVIAIPGYGTTAYLLLRLALGDPAVIVVAFDQIPRVVAEGQADAGLLIHEGQITYGAMGLSKVLDLGEVWTKRTGLPLPLGVNVTRRDLGEDLARELSEALRASIRYAHSHPDEAVGYALRYGRGIDADVCTRFVHMYVNDYTVTLGEEGRRALETLYREAVGARLLDAMPPLDPL
jgi:1,4-dihydroxy-6-naphthoate synthase